jgi:hypothetical protein
MRRGGEAMANDVHESVVLLATDDVRVIEERVPVGGGIPTHTHTEPFLLVAICGDRGEILDADGNVVFDVDYKALSPGFMGYMGPEHLPNTHALRNTGTEPIVVLQVELLSSAKRDDPPSP